jgi:hypothetical protein
MAAESQLKAGRLTQRKEHQKRRKFLNVESMARVPVTVMEGRLTQTEEHQKRRRFLNVESMARVPSYSNGR